jgi:dTDP-4-dehydrorhamnose reductase
MKKILIMGSAGMLGHMVYTYLKGLNNYEIFDTSFQNKINNTSFQIDATDLKEMARLFDMLKPDIVVNCIGILIKGSREDSANAIYLNSFLPHQLSNLQKKHGGRVIQISTDCVFSGNKGSYSEDDFRDARDIYGLSKALGEIVNDRDLTLRTSIIGPELKLNGEGLFHWFMSQSGTIKGYTKVFWGGVTTLVLAKAISYSVENDFRGLYHVTPGYPISKFELLKLMKKTWNKNITIVPDDSNLSDKSLLNKRPGFSFSTGTYEEMLANLFEFMKGNRELYNHYDY